MQNVVSKLTATRQNLNVCLVQGLMTVSACNDRATGHPNSTELQKQQIQPSVAAAI